MDMARCGILVGTAMGGMQTFATACEDLAFRVTTPPGLPLSAKIHLPPFLVAIGGWAYRFASVIALSSLGHQVPHLLILKSRIQQ